MADVKAVMAGLEAQVQCYRALAKLAELQHEHVQHDRTEELMEVLGRRQEIVDKLGVLEGVVGPVRRGWAEFAGGLDAGVRARAEGMIAESRRLLEQITTADRHDALVLQQRKLSVGRELGRSAGAAVVNKSYAAAAYGSRTGGMDVRQ